MKKIFTIALLMSCSAVFAQDVVVTRKTMTGAEYNRMRAVTDSKVYDQTGNVVDSAKAVQMVKSFDYEVNSNIPPGQTERKHMIAKINHARVDQSDKEYIPMSWPKNPALAAGTTLDLSGLARHFDVKKLDGKAVVLIFRDNRYGSMYEQINYAIENSIDSHKFEVFDITNLDYASAKTAQKAAPILNAHSIVDATDVTDFYQTTGNALIVVTNAQHQITYAAKGGPGGLARILNNQLKTL